MPKVAVTCARCGAEAWRWPSEVKGHDAVYCSQRCHNLERRGKPAPPTARRSYDRCQACGVEYGQLRRAAGCSHRCRMVIVRRRWAVRATAVAERVAEAEERLRFAEVRREVAEAGHRRGLLPAGDLADIAAEAAEREQEVKELRAEHRDAVRQGRGAPHPR